MEYPITEPQLRVLRKLNYLTLKDFMPPTIAELSEASGFKGAGAVVCHLKALEKKGYIKKKAGISRGLLLTEKGKEEVQ